jgi:uncharacterized membrane protein (UPF0127 family)
MRRLGIAVTVAVLALTTAACTRVVCKGAKCVSRVDVRIGDGAGKSWTVELAATPEARSRGLMGRRTVEPGRGMLFLFPRPVQVGFWMKNTLANLDIAFISGDRVLEVHAMTPCRADPCPLTRPSRPYDQALEVPAGELASVRSGDRVQIEGNLPNPS